MKDDKEVLKHFDKVFNTETAKHIIIFDNMKLLKTLYEYFEEDIYTSSNKYSELRHKYIEFSNELEKTFTPEQKKYLKNIGKLTVK